MKYFLLFALLTSCCPKTDLIATCGSVCYDGPPNTRNVGICHDGISVCDGGETVECLNEQLPQSEVCDSLDNDCNGLIDDNIQSTACYTGPPNTKGKGICHDGNTVCESGKIVCENEQLPKTELCTFPPLDLNCDGIPNNIEETFCYDGPPNTVGVGVCHPGVQKCDGGELICFGEETPQPQQCNGLDNGCNGQIEPNTTNPIDVVFILDTNTDPAGEDSMAPYWNNTIQTIIGVSQYFDNNSLYKFAIILMPKYYDPQTTMGVSGLGLDFSTYNAISQFLINLSPPSNIPQEEEGEPAYNIDTINAVVTGQFALSWDNSTTAPYRFIVLFTPDEAESGTGTDITNLGNQLAVNKFIFLGFTTNATTYEYQFLATSSNGSLYLLDDALTMSKELEGALFVPCQQ